jgi:hypothetical protein
MQSSTHERFWTDAYAFSFEMLNEVYWIPRILINKLGNILEILLMATYVGNVRFCIVQVRMTFYKWDFIVLNAILNIITWAFDPFKIVSGKHDSRLA